MTSACCLIGADQSGRPSALWHLGNQEGSDGQMKMSAGGSCWRECQRVLRRRTPKKLHGPMGVGFMLHVDPSTGLAISWSLVYLSVLLAGFRPGRLIFHYPCRADADPDVQSPGGFLALAQGLSAWMPGLGKHSVIPPPTSFGRCPPGTVVSRGCHLCDPGAGGRAAPEPLQQGDPRAGT